MAAKCQLASVWFSEQLGARSARVVNMSVTIRPSLSLEYSD